MIWHPIQDLPDDWRSLVHEDIHALAQVWESQRSRLEQTNSYKDFMERMRRRIAIETGVIEQLYTIDRGTTQLLIEQRIDEALIPNNATDKPIGQVV
ncbi:MAG: Fic family protein, partial [Chloroflexota bacterium]